MAIAHATDQDFDQLIGEGIVLVDFHAEWCGPCQMLGPILDALSTEQDKVAIVKVDVDKFPSIAQKYGVMSMPTMIVFKDGEKIDQKVGLMPKDALETWFASL